MVEMTEAEYRVAFEKDPERIRQLCSERRLRVFKDHSVVDADIE